MCCWEYEPNIVGGMGRHVSELLLAMDKAGAAGGWEIHLLTPAIDALPLHELVRTNVHVHRFTWPGQEGGRIYDDSRDLVEHILQLNRCLLDRAGKLSDRMDFQLIHAHDWLTAPGSLELSQAWDTPLVATFHATEKGRHYGHLRNELNRRIHEIEAALCRAASHNIVCSRYMRDNLMRCFSQEQDRFTVIPNGVNCQSFAREDAHEVVRIRRIYKPHGEFLLLFVGRPAHCKGLHVLLDAMPLILESHPHVRLVVAGQDSRDLQADITARGLASEVSLLGYIPDATRNSLMKSADASIMPSLYEPFGIVALEAMAAGCPVAASAVGGLAEVIDHEETGLTFHPDNPHSIAWAVDHLIRHPEKARMRKAAALRKAGEAFRWDRIAAQTLKVYESVCANGTTQGD